MTMLTSFLKVVDDEMVYFQMISIFFSLFLMLLFFLHEKVGKMLQKNMMSILVTTLQAKEGSNFELADSTLESIKTVLAKETISPEAQISIMENVLNNSGHVAFDKNTSTCVFTIQNKRIYVDN